MDRRSDSGGDSRLWEWSPSRQRRPWGGESAVLVGGVSQLYQGDLDLGRVAVERLSTPPPPPGVLVEDLHYGAIAVAQRLEDVRPGLLVLVGAEQRGRAPGSVERRVVRAPDASRAQLQDAVGNAATGYVSIDLLVAVAHAFDALPARTIAIEVEPATVVPSQRLSPAGERGLEEALDLVRAEVAAATAPASPGAAG